MARFMVYNAGGLTIPVEAELSLPFYFECSTGDCGKEVVIEGKIIEVSESKFNEVLEEVIDKNPEFKAIREIKVRKYLFVGTVNGVDAILPAEAMEDFAERFIKDIGSILILR